MLCVSGSLSYTLPKYYWIINDQPGTNLNQQLTIGWYQMISLIFLFQAFQVTKLYFFQISKSIVRSFNWSSMPVGMGETFGSQHIPKAKAYCPAWSRPMELFPLLPNAVGRAVHKGKKLEMAQWYLRIAAYSPWIAERVVGNHLWAANSIFQLLAYSTTSQHLQGRCQYKLSRLWGPQSL